MICSVCGREIKMSCKNWKLVDGKPRHIKCPTGKPRLSVDDSKKYRQLMDRITYHLNINPRGYIKDTGLNFKKVANQVKDLKSRGYSYDDQLYALDECVKVKNGFWGYSSVVNNISWIIDRRNQIEAKKKKAKQSVVEQKTYDLSDMIKEKEDEWL